MASLLQFDARLKNGTPITELEIDQWILDSDPSNQTFLSHNTNADFAAARSVSQTLIKVYLNNPDVAVVPLRTKTKFCLILNNLALTAMRPAVFESLGDLTSIFESSIRDEGAMPFDSELGRMSEHVLVLLMRVTDCKLPASGVLEFAEGNMQFAIQLLLAILLKEPPYEFDLRCSCISGLYGFTQPQAFFGPGSQIEEHSCSKFTSKINFMLDLMQRLKAVQVVSDIIGEALCDTLKDSVVSPHTCEAVNNTMRAIMNIFKFSSENSLAWRQHILLSTSFADGTVVLVAEFLSKNLLDALAHNPGAPLPPHLLPSLILSFKFCTFATYHLGDAATEMSMNCPFFHDLLQLPLRMAVTDPRQSQQMMVLFVSMFHFMSNVNSLSRDERMEEVDMVIPELTSAELTKSLTSFFMTQVGPCGLPFLQAWKTQFHHVDTNTMVAMESATFQLISSIFTSCENELKMKDVQKAAVAPTATPGRLLGDMPTLTTKKQSSTKKISIDEAAAPVKMRTKIKVVNLKTDTTTGVDRSLLCALTGHVMKNPVSTPYGHSFESDAIHSWLRENGSVCPITGKPLNASQLVPNTALAAMVMQQVVRQSMAPQSQSDDADLYNF